MIRLCRIKGEPAEVPIKEEKKMPEKLRNTLQNIMKNKSILAFASIIIGVVMMFAGGSIAESLIKVVGYVLVGTAAAYLVSYFMAKDKDSINLGYSVLAAAAGILLIVLAGPILNLFPRILGIVLVINGVTNLSQANVPGAAPKYSKAVSIIILIVGVLVFFRPGVMINAVTFVAGAALILNGLAELDIIRRFW